MPVGAKFLVALALALVVAGCQQQLEPTHVDVGEAPSIQPPPQPAKTMEDWNDALADSYDVSNVTDEGDGVSSFIACYVENGEKSCAISRRDAFRKLRFFTLGFNSSISFNADPNVKTYISLPDGKSPALFLSPVFVGDSWIFIDKVAVMIGSEVVLEQEIEHNSVKREVFPNGDVEEVANFIANDTQIKALRAINSESDVKIRLTGDKGYVSIADSEVKKIKEEIPLALAFYDRLNAKLAPNIPKEVSQ